MRLIHKFEVPTNGKIAASDDAVILKVDYQRNVLTAWIETDTAENQIYHTLFVIPTGGEVPAGAKYINTVYQGPLVWHIFKLNNE